MKKGSSKEKIIRVSIILISILLIFMLCKTNMLKVARNRINNTKQQEITTEVKGEVTTVNKESLNILITIENINGIERITGEDITLECKGKEKVALDRTIENGKVYQISVKLVGKETEEEYTIAAERLPNIVLANSDTTGDGSTKTVKIEYNTNEEYSKNYYSLDDGATWQEYTEELNILEEDNKTITGKSKPREEKVKGKLIIVQPVEEHLPLVISRSLLEATQKAIMKNDTYYRIAIKDEEYRVHTYVQDEDLILAQNTVYGNASDAGTASSNATSMVIVKVNGNMTINNGVTLTSYGTAYGGTKGMLLYVTEKLENNGTITMTARGAKAEGQNVYLWENKDTSVREKYEYVPELGAYGGASVSGTSIGTVGESGANRKTGRRRFWSRMLC